MRAVLGVEVPEIVPLLVGHHLQRQFVVVAQEDGPLAGFRDLRRLAHDVGDRVPVFLGDRHIHARHQREVERHVAFVAALGQIAEIGQHVFRPLVGFGQQHAVGIAFIHGGADLLQDVVGLAEVLVVGALALDQVGHGVEPEPVHAHLQPVAQHAQHFAHHGRIVEVQVRLVRIEAVPEIGLCDRVPGPVGLLRIEEDDPGALVLLVVVAPDIEIPVVRARLCGAGALEPGVLVGGVVDDQFRDDPDAAIMAFTHELPEVAHVAVGRIDVAVIRDVIPVIAQRRRVERQQPQCRDTEFLKIVELSGQPREVADAVIVGIEEGLHVELIDDGILVPEAVVAIDHGISGCCKDLGAR